MKAFQKVIKYVAIGFAILLALAIVAGLAATAVRLLSWVGIADGGSVDEHKSYEITESVSVLEIDLSAAALEIKTDERMRVESDVNQLKLVQNGGKLTIKESKRLIHTTTPASVIIYLPKTTVFEFVQISNDAGTVSIDALSAARAELEFGAGDVVLSNLNVSRGCEINGGAGRIEILSGTVRNCSIELGMGELVFQGKAEGECSIESGMGSVSLTLIGKQEEYTLSIDHGLGGVTVNGSTISGNVSLGSGANKIHLEQGMGGVDIIFKGVQ